MEDKAKVELEDRIKAAVRKQMARTNPTAGASEPAVAPPPPISTEERSVTLGPRQRWFTEVTGISKNELTIAHGLEDFGVTVLDPSAIPSEVSAFVPAVNPLYVLQVEEAHAALMGLECGDKCLTTGPTGSGKSTMWEQLAARTNRPYIRINSSLDMESATFFGSMVAEKGETPWKNGPVTEGVLYGALVCIDEYDVTPAEILFGLQWLFEKGGKLYLKEKPGDSKDKFITPHPDFRLVCCGNTVGQGDDTGKFTGTTVQNTATLDRFGTTIYLNYLPQEHEVKMLTAALPTLNAVFINKMVSMAKLVRVAYEQGNVALTMSPRTLLNWGEKMLLLNDARLALSRAFMAKLRESDKRIVDELFAKTFGRS